MVEKNTWFVKQVAVSVPLVLEEWVGNQVMTTTQAEKQQSQMPVCTVLYHLHFQGLVKPTISFDANSISKGAAR